MSDLFWTNVAVRLGDLKPWARNPKTISKRNAERLLRSWDEMGQFQTVAIGPDGEVYDGHQRLSVLLAARGAEYMIDARRSNRALTDDERAKLVLTAHVGTTGAWDWSELAAWDETLLQDCGFDAALLKEWNDDAANLSEMLKSMAGGEPAEAPEAQIDRAAELQEKWQTSRGQLWEIPSQSVPGRCHRVLCGDSTDAGDVARLMDETEADLLLTDPPYGISVVKGAAAAIGGSKPVTIGSIRARRPDTVGGVKVLGTDGAKHKVDATLYRPVAGDDKPFDPAHLLGVAKNAIIFGGNYFASKLPDSRCWIVWDKDNTGNFADAELAWTDFDRGVRLYKFTWNGLVREGSRDIEGVNRWHPTQKPAGLMQQILSDFADKESVIVDLYMGSGSVLVGCELAGMVGYGMDIDPAYLGVILERLASMGLAPRLVEPAAVAAD